MAADFATTVEIALSRPAASMRSRAASAVGAWTATN